MKKLLILTLCAVLLSLALAGCGEKIDTSSASPLPSPTAGSTVSAFTGKVTARKGTSVTVDMMNGSMNSATITSAPPSSMPKAVSPSPNSGVTKGVTVIVPVNAAVTLQDGKAGKLTDIKSGVNASFTMVDNVVTAVAIEKK